MIEPKAQITGNSLQDMSDFIMQKGSDELDINYGKFSTDDEGEATVIFIGRMTLLLELLQNYCSNKLKVMDNKSHSLTIEASIDTTEKYTVSFTHLEDGDVNELLRMIKAN